MSDNNLTPTPTPLSKSNVLTDVLNANEQLGDTTKVTVAPIQSVKTSKYALKFACVFDLAIDKFGHTDIFVPCSVGLNKSKDKHITAETLRFQLSNAINYLMHNEFEDKSLQRYKLEHYVNLRQAIEFVLSFKEGVGAGILIRFKIITNKVQEISSRLVLDSISAHEKSPDSVDGTLNLASAINNSSEPLWMIKLMEFLNDGSKSILKLSGPKDLGVLLTLDDIEKVQRMLLQADIECQVTSTMIRAVK